MTTHPGIPPDVSESVLTGWLLPSNNRFRISHRLILDTSLAATFALVLFKFVQLGP